MSSWKQRLREEAKKLVQNPSAPDDPEVDESASAVPLPPRKKRYLSDSIVGLSADAQKATVPAWARATEAETALQKPSSASLEAPIESVFPTEDAGRGRPSASSFRPGVLSYSTLKPVNAGKKSRAAITVVTFHPTRPLCLVASPERRVELFPVEPVPSVRRRGASVPTMSWVLEGLPVYSAAMDPTGSTVVVAGEGRDVYSLDVATGASTRITAIHSALRGCKPAKGVAARQRVALSPDGAIAAITGAADGLVHLLSMRSASVVASLRTGSVSGYTVRAVFDPYGSGGAGASESDSVANPLLVCDGERLAVWDLRMLSPSGSIGRPLRSTILQSTLGVQSLACSPSGVAVSGDAGEVSIYDRRPGEDGAPLLEFRKDMLQLQTPVDSLCYAAGGQYLVGASSFRDAAVRMWHPGTYSAFSNFPSKDSAASSVGFVHSLATTPSGGLVCCGCADGSAKLFRIAAFSPF